LLYILPGSLSRSELGTREIDRRLAILQRLAAPGTEVSITDVPDGPRSIESAYEEYLSVPGTLLKVQEAERSGLDAAIVGCFGDPGVDAARELVEMLVIGPAEASMLFACSLGHRFSVITVLESVVASVRAVDIPVLELNKDRARSVARMIALARRAVAEDGADALVLGCMSMGFLEAHAEISAEAGVPVVNPVYAALRMAEALHGAGLRHSKRAYPLPPKLRPVTVG
jgi:allantoin racemase